MTFIQNLHKQAFIVDFVNKNKIVNFIQVKLYESKLRPLSLIYNQKSGFHAAQPRWQYDVYDVWTQYGFEIQVFELNQQLILMK